jgi:proteasome alpha subunit
MKPMEVEILVAEVGITPDGDQLFHILYDGTVMDERRYSVLGGDAETIAKRVDEGWSEGLDLGAAVRLGCSALGGPDRTIDPGDLEVAILSRTNGRRCFRRLVDQPLAELLAT